MDLIWFVAFAAVWNPLAGDSTSAMVRAEAWRQTEPLFTDTAAEVRRDAIRWAHLFGLIEVYPQLVREAFGPDALNRRAALAAMRGIAERNDINSLDLGDRRAPEVENRTRRARELGELSGAQEILSLQDRAEDVLTILHAPSRDRTRFIKDTLDRLAEDFDYGPEDVPGGCGFGTVDVTERTLNFLAVHSRFEFETLAKRYLADSKAKGKGNLVSIIRSARGIRGFEASIRPLLDHPKTGVRVPAMLAMASVLPIGDLKRRMKEDPSGAVRLAAFWALASHDEETALNLALPRLAMMVPDERFQVLCVLYDASNGRRRLRDLAGHKDAKVAREVRAFLRAADEQEKNSIRP